VHRRLDVGRDAPGFRWVENQIHSIIVIKPSRIAPSILAADFAHLADDIGRIEDHVDLLHVDVMDGHFVPNISLGMPVIASLRAVTDLKLDCHLMTLNPDAYLEDLKAAGGDLASVHIEVFPDPTSVASMARDAGLEFGLVVNPPTPFEAIEPFIELVDMVVVMSVHPGFGGQAFIEGVLPKIERVRKFIDSAGLGTDIEVDGGIDANTIRSARDAGADVFVAGTSVFRAPDPVAAVRGLRIAIGQ
jgi:ribulose-phosphate 3-epimerase